MFALFRQLLGESPVAASGLQLDGPNVRGRGHFTAMVVPGVPAPRQPVPSAPACVPAPRRFPARDGGRGDACGTSTSVCASHHHHHCRRIQSMTNRPIPWPAHCPMAEAAANQSPLVSVVLIGGTANLTHQHTCRGKATCLYLGQRPALAPSPSTS